MVFQATEIDDGCSDVSGKRSVEAKGPREITSRYTTSRSLALWRISVISVVVHLGAMLSLFVVSR